MEYQELIERIDEARKSYDHPAELDDLLLDCRKALTAPAQAMSSEEVEAEIRKLGRYMMRNNPRDGSGQSGLMELVIPLEALRPLLARLQQQDPVRSDEGQWPAVRGIGRDNGNSRALCVYFDDEPTAQQIQAVHAALSATPAPVSQAGDKPSWDDAPEWAQWLAGNCTGAWRWFERRPAPHDSGYWSTLGAGKSLIARDMIGGQPNPNWRNTLEQRPTPEPISGQGGGE